MELISVLMPIYNDEKYIDRAIQSVLNQSYENFELLLLLEYGSNETCRKIVYSYNDKRIRVIENKQRLGIAESLNVGIREAKGNYIARMDSDDICLKNRFEKQLKYMKDKNVDLLGTGAFINGNRIKKLKRPSSHQEIAITAFFYNPFIHPSIMMKKSVLIENNILYANMKSSEDYELWTRLICCANTANINCALLNYTIRNDNKTHKDSDYMNKDISDLQKAYALNYNINYDFEGVFDTIGLSEREIIEREKYVINILQKFQTYKCSNKIIAKEIAKLYVHNGRCGLRDYVNKIIKEYNFFSKIQLSFLYLFYAMREKVKGYILNNE